MREKYDIVTTLLTLLPRRLAEFGVSPEIIAALLEEDQIDVERFRLRVDGGSRRRTFRTEMEHFRLQYKNPRPGYILFKWFVGALTLLIPSRHFYQLRDWYGQRDLKRFRNMLGKPEFSRSQTFIQRHTVAPMQLGSCSFTPGDQPRAAFDKPPNSPLAADAAKSDSSRL